MTKADHLHQIARAKARAMRKLKIDRIRLLARSSVPFLLNGPSPREIGKADAAEMARPKPEKQPQPRR